MTTLHASYTNTTVHAYQSAGESNTVPVVYYLTNQSGSRLTDQSGNYLIAPVFVTVSVLHAPPTDTTVHADD